MKVNLERVAILTPCAGYPEFPLRCIPQYFKYDYYTQQIKKLLPLNRLPLDNQIQHCGMRRETGGLLHLRFMRCINGKEDLTTTLRNLWPLSQTTICLCKRSWCMVLCMSQLPGRNTSYAWKMSKFFLVDLLLMPITIG